jgi:hypothetical protein
MMTPEERAAADRQHGTPPSEADLQAQREQAIRFQDFIRQLGLGGQFETHEGARATPMTEIAKRSPAIRKTNLNNLPPDERNQVFNVSRWAHETPYKPGDIDINREPEPPEPEHPVGKKKPPKKEKR